MIFYVGFSNPEFCSSCTSCWSRWTVRTSSGMSVWSAFKKPEVKWEVAIMPLLFVYLFVNLYMYILYIYIIIYIYTHVNIYICIYVYIFCIHIYIYTYTYTYVYNFPVWYMKILYRISWYITMVVFSGYVLHIISTGKFPWLAEGPR